jgi:ABC-2 type transport system ATP-binding protein
VLQQVPIVKDLLSPLIGRADRVDILIDVSDYIGEGMAPIAFTTKITSFDGVRISVNYFPKSGLGFGEEAPTILNGPSLATAGYINLSQPNTVSGLVPGISQIRENYNVVTWDPRGEFASGGRMHLDSELFEARDVSEIISWVARQPGTDLEGDTDDPLVGMVGGSYGGGIQLTSAGIDSRIDAIAPGIAWNSLDTALYPNNAFKTSWASLLALSLAVTGSRPDLEIYAGIFTGVLTGFLTPGQQRFLSENSPDTVVGNITAPTLFLQGTVDGLFVLEQALANAEALNGDVPVRMIWYCGGHGWCLDLDDDEKAEQTAYLTAQTLAWMDTYVLNKENGGAAPATGPEFVWVDQNGDWFTADNLPIDQSFYGTETIEASGTGGVLPLVPILGGSGPQTLAPFPLSLPAAAESGHALEVTVSNPDPESDTPLHVVGAPSLTFTYSGLGTSRHVYAQLVDNETHRVLGNLVTPIPVTLDGRQRTVTFDMENIAYTMGADDSLTLQIVDSATAYEDFTSFGLVTITDVSITMPTAAVATPMTLPPAVGAPAVGPASPSVEDVLTGGLRR